MTDPTQRSATELPTHITRAQLLAACEALGIPSRFTKGWNFGLRVGIETVTVLKYDADENGKRFVVGGHPAMSTTRIPVADIAPEVTS